MVKCCVLFPIRTEFLNIIFTSLVSKDFKHKIEIHLQGVSGRCYNFRRPFLMPVSNMGPIFKCYRISDVSLSEKAHSNMGPIFKGYRISESV
jgi:hypothetical protein